MSEVTRILEQIQQGNAHEAKELLPLVYDELRKLAAQPKLGNFLHQDAAEMVLTSDQLLAERPGTVIGPYKLLQQIGESALHQ